MALPRNLPLKSSIKDRLTIPRNWSFDKLKTNLTLPQNWAFSTPESSTPDAIESEVIVKYEAAYRLKRIEIKRGDAIDQIKFIYSDDSTWAIGHDSGGKADVRPAIMTEGEYLVRVTHEKLYNLRCAAASVEFETNKGRVFAYQPKAMTTNSKSEQTTIHAEPGKEIIGLKIHHGILLGTQQQDCEDRQPQFHIGQSENTPGIQHKQWYAIGYLYQKEDDDEIDNDVTCESDVRFKHFQDLSSVKSEWKRISSECSSKKGRGAVMFDCMKLIKMKEAGGKDSVIKCIAKAKETGLFALKMEGDVSMIDTLVMLYKVLNNKKDVYMLLFVMLLLFTSFYFELEVQMLTGYVMAMVTMQSNDTSLVENPYIINTCQYIWECDDTTDYRLRLILALILVSLAERLFYVTNVYFHHNACDSKNKRMQINAFKHILSLDQSYFDNHSESDIRGCMNVHAINNLISWNIPYLIGLTLQLFMTGAYMIKIDYRLGSMAIAAFLAMKYGLLNHFEKMEKSSHKIQRKLDMISSQTLDDALSMITSVKYFSKETYHLDDYSKSRDRHIDNLNRVVVLRCIREFSYGILRVAIFGSMLYIAFAVIKDTNFTPGHLASFFLLMKSFQDLFGRVGWHTDILVREFSDIERFMELMRTQSKLTNGSIKLEKVTGEIEFKDVVFEYPSRPGEKVLKGLNLKIQPKKMTAIVGDSGAGKSTIAKMLMRLYDPCSGSISLDGQDIKSLDLESLHNHVGIVNQNPDLFDATLADNIGYGTTTKEYTDQQVQDAADIANCGFISKFRGKFDTFAGKGGTNISGGQKQRVAIARAAIHDPSVLILDEATSSLDAANEALVQDALESIMKNRTILVIAHRLSTIKNADEIIVMRDGGVVEQGTHASLMQDHGVYYKLVNAQIVEEENNRKVGE